MVLNPCKPVDALASYCARGKSRSHRAPHQLIGCAQLNSLCPEQQQVSMDVFQPLHLEADEDRMGPQSLNVIVPLCDQVYDGCGAPHWT